MTENIPVYIKVDDAAIALKKEKDKPT